MKKSIALIGLILILSGCQTQTVSKEGDKTLPANQEENSTVPTGWETYKNDELKFTFDHPSEWTIKDMPKEANQLLMLGMGLPGLSDATAWVMVIPGTDLTKAIDAHVKGYVEGTIAEREEAFKLDGVEGKMIYLNVGGMSPDLDRWVFAVHDSKTYIIGITLDQAPYDVEFDKILSSFKFI